MMKARNINAQFVSVSGWELGEKYIEQRASYRHVDGATAALRYETKGS